MKRTVRPLRWALLALLLMSAPACLAAAAAAGAGGAIAWTQRGASSTVSGSVDQVYQRAEAVFRDMGITATGQSSGDQGEERSLKGTRDDMEITVEIERESASTSEVEVFARKNTVEFDRNYARDVLTRIVNRS
jgi:hypothetical protein